MARKAPKRMSQIIYPASLHLHPIIGMICSAPAITNTAVSSDDADKVKRDPRRLFATRRTRLWFTLFVIFFAVNAAELGLVSQQIHERGTVVDVNTTWPGAEVEHVFGLLLFACLVSLLFAIFHWAFNLAIYVVVFFVSIVHVGY